MNRQQEEEFERIEAEIASNGKLAGGDSWLRRVEALTGQSARSFQAVVPEDGNSRLIPAAGNTKIVKFGSAPEGYGQIVDWDRSTDAILLTLYVHAADVQGIAIKGLKTGDRISVSSASGIASFSKDKGNPMMLGITSVLAAGGRAILDSLNRPEFKQVIDAGERFAQQFFKAPTGTDAEIKMRTAFGIDPSSGHKARAEGGVIVCMPQQNGATYSGDDDHQDRWIKKPGDRYDSNRPNQALGSFFVQQVDRKTNSRICTSDGEAYVLAWDHKFADNVGFYRLFLGIENGQTIPVDPGPE